MGGYQDELSDFLVELLNVSTKVREFFVKTWGFDQKVRVFFLSVQKMVHERLKNQNYLYFVMPISIDIEEISAFLLKKIRLRRKITSKNLKSSVFTPKIIPKHSVKKTLKTTLVLKNRFFRRKSVKITKVIFELTGFCTFKFSIIHTYFSHSFLGFSVLILSIFIEKIDFLIRAWF